MIILLTLLAVYLWLSGYLFSESKHESDNIKDIVTRLFYSTIWPVVGVLYLSSLLAYKTLGEE
ncbi:MULTISPECIES: hypothetical protein [Proteus]|uniref:hypothetical protein n=1 Tax=Proteus TaxID=583 RepID=UPI000B4142DF|nr:hypothetical protein [Proteus terrae]RNT28797.1 hypothetical protein B9475_005975 [Proteus mirabilis]